MEFLADIKNEDDDLMMIVVDHENDDKKHSTGKKILKSEKSEAGDDVHSDTELFLESEEVDVKFEQDDDEDYLPEDFDEDSDEYCEEEYLPVKCKSEQKQLQRKKMRTPAEQQSFVGELRKKNPELTEELLINKLRQIMLDVKHPVPPKGYFINIDNLFECAECGQRKRTIPAVSRHWQHTHGPRYAFCYACGVDFRSITNLYKHEKICSAPDAVVVLKARAQVLGRKGRGRPFIPDLPLSKKQLRRLGKKQPCRFACGDCDAVFRFERSLKKHAADVHSGPRPYRCDVCPAAYSKPLSLYKHKREKHLNEPLPCDVCGRTFMSKYNLKLHMDTHSQLRRFVCAHCERAYSKKSNLLVHIDREHLQLPAPFACHSCPKRYYRMEELKDHMLRCHGMHLISHHSLKRVLPKLSESQVQKMEAVKNSDKDQDSDVEIVPENTDKNLGCSPKPEEKAGKQLPKIIIDKMVKLNDEKRFEFLKCTEKLESGSEMELQEAVQIEIIDDEVREDFDNAEVQMSEEDTPEDLLEYAENLQQDNSHSEKPKPLIIIKDGQAIFMDQNNVDFFKKAVTKKENIKDRVQRKEPSDPDTFDSDVPMSQDEKKVITKFNNSAETMKGKAVKVLKKKKEINKERNQDICRPTILPKKRQRK